MEAKRRRTKKKGKSRGPNAKLKQIMDPVLAKALSHRLRGHVLATLGDRIASPKEMADEIEVDVRELNYHVTVLARAGLIKLVRTEKRRGAREHFYALGSPVPHQNGIVMMLDDRGCREVLDLMAETAERLQQVRAASAMRLDETAGEGVPMEVFMIGFETAAGGRRTGGAVADA